MAYVFISYSHHDGTEYADELYETLEAHHLNPWRDKLAITASYAWSQEIDDAIEDSYAMVVIGTKEAMQSVGVTYEWAKAMGMGIPVLAMDVDNVTKEVLQFKKSHYLDYHSPDFSESILRDLRKLKDQDSVTNVRIPFEADAELKALARQAFDSSLSFEANKQAIERLADMVDEPLACQILTNGLNKREYNVVNFILSTINNSYLKNYEPYILPKLLEFLLIKEAGVDNRRINYQKIASEMLHKIKLSSDVYTKLLNTLKSDDYSLRTKQEIFDHIWYSYHFDDKTNEALQYMLCHNDKNYFQYAKSKISSNLPHEFREKQSQFIEFLNSSLMNYIQSSGEVDKNRLVELKFLVVHNLPILGEYVTSIELAIDTKLTRFS